MELAMYVAIYFVVTLLFIAIPIATSLPLFQNLFLVPVFTKLLANYLVASILYMATLFVAEVNESILVCGEDGSSMYSLSLQ